MMFGAVPEHITLPNAELIWFSQALSAAESDMVFAALHHEIDWQTRQIRLYGKQHQIPRLEAWHGDAGATYTYSGETMYPTAWTPTLLSLKKTVESLAAENFNSVLLNLYRNGQDGMGWHSDDEPELGSNPVIASLSLGDTRRFILRHKRLKQQPKYEIPLVHGSLLIMCGETQHYWQHHVPKTAKPIGPRINLTFRQVGTLT